MNWEIITGMSSVFIALCAFFFSIWQGIQARRHNRLSFRPHLATSDYSDTSKGVYSIELNNNGLGPAVITDFILYVDGRRMSGDGAKPIEKALKILFQDYPYRSQHTGLGDGYVMAAKDKCNILAIKFIGPLIPSEEFVEHAFNRGDIEILYKSFYEEKFHFSTLKEGGGKIFGPRKNDIAQN